MKLNTNERVWVRLTEHGKDILRTREAGLRLPFRYRYALRGWREDVWSGELWTLMALWGPHMYNGCAIPFVDNDLNFGEGPL